MSRFMTLATILCAFTIQAFATAPYVKFPWGDKPGEIGMHLENGGDSPFGANFYVVDDTGNFFVSDTVNHRIQRYDKEGKYIETFAVPNLEFISFMTIPKSWIANGKAITPPVFIATTNSKIGYLKDGGIQWVQKGVSIPGVSFGFGISPQGIYCIATQIYRTTQKINMLRGSDNSYLGQLNMSDVLFDRDGNIYGISNSKWENLPVPMMNLTITSTGMLIGDKTEKAIEIKIPGGKKISITPIDVREEQLDKITTPRFIYLYVEDWDNKDNQKCRVMQYSLDGKLCKQVVLDDIWAEDISHESNISRIRIAENGDVLVANAVKDGQQLYRLQMVAQ